jgi:hypothetical protein
MSSTPRFSRAEIVMDCIAVADVALLALLTFILIAGSPALPFSDAGARECAAGCTRDAPPAAPVSPRGSGHG